MDVIINSVRGNV